jgi:hypothetical protein
MDKCRKGKPFKEHSTAQQGNKTDGLFLFTQTTCLFTKIERTTE